MPEKLDSVPMVERPLALCSVTLLGSFVWIEDDPFRASVLRESETVSGRFVLYGRDPSALRCDPHSSWHPVDYQVFHVPHCTDRLLKLFG